jgi:hypothetical protein
VKGNELGDEGVKALCEALKGHKGEPPLPAACIALHQASPTALPSLVDPFEAPTIAMFCQPQS